MKTWRRVWILVGLAIIALGLWQTMESGKQINRLRADGVVTVGEQIEENRIAGELGNLALCFLGPGFIFCCLMVWRNDAGMKKERRHQEMIAAMQGRDQPVFDARPPAGMPDYADEVRTWGKKG